MEKRTILISLAVAFLTIFTSKVIFRFHSAAKDYLYSENGNYIYPLFSSLSDPIVSSSWFIPGALAGYLCTKHPMKHGAVSGALFGFAIGFINIAKSSSQIHELSMRLAYLGYATVSVLENAVLFTIAAAFGYHFNTRRAEL
jgi:hypothetical protein